FQAHRADGEARSVGALDLALLCRILRRRLLIDRKIDDLVEPCEDGIESVENRIDDAGDSTGDFISRGIEDSADERFGDGQNSVDHRLGDGIEHTADGNRPYGEVGVDSRVGVVSAGQLSESGIHRDLAVDGGKVEGGNVCRQLDDEVNVIERIGQGVIDLAGQSTEGIGHGIGDLRDRVRGEHLGVRVEAVEVRGVAALDDLREIDLDVTVGEIDRHDAGLVLERLVDDVLDDAVEGIADLDGHLSVVSADIDRSDAGIQIQADAGQVVDQALFADDVFEGAACA